MIDPDRQCNAKAKSTGKRCTQPVVPGTAKCRFHGSGNRVSREAGARRIAEQQARQDVARFAARTDIHPAEALLELVQYQAGVVAYWRARVEQVAEEDLTWGTTRVKEGGDDRGTTQEAKPNIAYTLLREAQHDLATYAAAALKAGVDERRVRLAEQTGALVADVIRRILADLDLTESQQLLVGEVVPRHLRAIAAGGERA